MKRIINSVFFNLNFNSFLKIFTLFFVLISLTGCLTNSKNINHDLIYFKEIVKQEKCINDFRKNVMKITLMKKLTVYFEKNRKISFGMNSMGSVVFVKNLNGKSYFLTSEHLFSKSMNSVNEFYKYVKQRFKNNKVEITTRLIISDHDLKQFEAFYVSSDYENDLALLKSDKIIKICNIRIFKGKKMETNSEVISAGYAKGIQFKNVVWSWKGLYLGEVGIFFRTKGLFFMRKIKKYMSLYSFPSFQGCSGGGIFHNGELVGIISGTGITVNHSTVATPMKKIKIFLKKYLNL